ncbi:murein hydrolase activator EnvC family protein [Portibacter lacus]|uniref:murein hydrolase activator EnvC family protein n=1 Tax=Portibacter lacus TaxID=1099794 RepID=UPI001F47F638|nr:peptidoglycan DD-metalloendopeptidase family protein [Portibacter lacus]
MKKISSFLFLTLILLGSFKANAQTREDLEKRRFEIIQQIDDTNELLNLTAKNKKVLISDLAIIDTQINNRKKLLEQIQKEIDLIDRDISINDSLRSEKVIRIDSLKDQYHIVLRAVYRERTLHNPLVALLSAKSVSSSFLKANFYNRLKQYVGEKLKVINDEQYLLDQKIANLNDDKDQKREVLQQVEKQSALLANEQARQKVMIASIQEDESTLKKTLDEQKKDREQMNVQIENVIKSKFTEGIASTTVSNFESLKGKMAWPVNGGVVSSKYGKQQHPTMKNLTISNNGIDIRAPLNAQVSAVFEGKVVSVSQMSGFGTTVIIDHNQYYTVYSKLQTATVSKGDEIKIGQNIGVLAVNDDSSELHFEIWNENKTQNPMSWLKG